MISLLDVGSLLDWLLLKGLLGGGGWMIEDKIIIFVDASLLVFGWRRRTVLNEFILVFRIRLFIRALLVSGGGGR